jgi:Holliday junction resolvasome RuvABC endonuclease subunit
MTFNRIAAFDLSLTSTGWSTFYEGKVDYGVFSAGTMGEMERLHFLLSHIRRTINATIDVPWVKTLVVLEDFAFARANQAHQLGGLGYLVRFWCWQSAQPYILVGPGQNKKFTGGKGSINKAVMMKYVLSKYGIDTNDDNAADAIGLAFIGRALLGQFEPTADAQRAVLKELRKKYPDLVGG